MPRILRNHYVTPSLGWAGRGGAMDLIPSVGRRIGAILGDILVRLAVLGILASMALLMRDGLGIAPGIDPLTLVLATWLCDATDAFAQGIGWRHRLLRFGLSGAATAAGVLWAFPAIGPPAGRAPLLPRPLRHPAGGPRRGAAAPPVEARRGLGARSGGDRSAPGHCQELRFRPIS
jgi:hypothetical protein